MALTKAMIREIEQAKGCRSDKKLTAYLKVTYGEEPFPYIRLDDQVMDEVMGDVRLYQTGGLDTTIKPLEERQQDEINYLKDLVAEGLNREHENQDRIKELTELLKRNGISYPDEDMDTLPFD